MKVTLPAEDIEVCDRCRRDGYLQQCPVCGGQFCLTCHGIIAGCWVDPDVCRGCARRPDVQAVVERHAAAITPIIKRRTADLKALPATLTEGEGDEPIHP